MLIVPARLVQVVRGEEARGVAGGAGATAHPAGESLRVAGSKLIEQGGPNLDQAQALTR